MEHKSIRARSIAAIVATVGAVSLFGATANAQTTTNPPAEKPAVQAPAAPAAAAQPGESAAKPAEKNATPDATAGKDSAADNSNRKAKRHSRRHRHYHSRGHRMGKHGWRGRSAQRNRWRNMSAEDRKAFFEARLASVKAGLMLNETQAKLWPYVETAVREMVAKRGDWAARIKKEGRLANPFDRMKRRGDIMADRAAAMQKLAIAAKPLYDTLSDSQKRRLNILTRGVRKMARARAMRRYQRMMRGQHRQRNWHRGGRFHQRGYGQRDRRSESGQGGSSHQKLEQKSDFDGGNGLANAQRI